MRTLLGAKICNPVGRIAGEKTCNTTMTEPKNIGNLPVHVNRDCTRDNGNMKNWATNEKVEPYSTWKRMDAKNFIDAVAQHKNWWKTTMQKPAAPNSTRWREKAHQAEHRQKLSRVSVQKRHLSWVIFRQKMSVRGYGDWKVRRDKRTADTWRN